jgi:regulator of sigma E protease
MDLLLGVALVLGVLILVHEWGHFIMARLFGVRVDVFSIGFGPRLFGWKRGATDYRISALPLGGYVRMAGQDPTDIDSPDHWKRTRGEEQGKGTQTNSDATHAAAAFRGVDQALATPTGAPDELMSKTRWQRALISLAGPVVNLIFPVLLLTGFYAIKGEPYPPYLELPVSVVALPPNAPTGPNAFEVGDKMVSIGGVQNPTWEQADKVLRAAAPGSALAVEVENSGVPRTVNLTVPPKDDEKAAQIFGYPPIPPVIDDVATGAPAERAGLTAGDRVLAVNGQEVHWWGEFVTRMRSTNGSPVTLKIERQGKTLSLNVTPEKTVLPQGETVYLIGVGPKEKYRPMPVAQSVLLAGEKTFETVQDTVGVVGRLLSGRVSVRQLQSVVGISRAAGQAVHKGPSAVLSLMVLISVNLGILNLLPIPILDGGNILLLAIEGGLRRDLSMAFKERFVQVGLVFLLVLFAIVMYNDVVRLLPSHS